MNARKKSGVNMRLQKKVKQPNDATKQHMLLLEGVKKQNLLGLKNLYLKHVQQPEGVGQNGIQPIQGRIERCDVQEQGCLYLKRFKQKLTECICFVAFFQDLK